jgi:hypothetical protein
VIETEDPAFRRTAGMAAILAGLAGLVYSVAFVALNNAGLASLMLMAGGLLTVLALVAVFRLVRAVSPGLATVGIVFGIFGAIGASIHGAYDLANAINPPGVTTELPSAVDPRGFLTFGVSGLGVFVLSALALRGDIASRGWSWLGLALGALLIVVYLGRLIVLDASSALILVPAAITGFVANPAWYVWLGTILLGRR